MRKITLVSIAIIATGVFLFSDSFTNPTIPPAGVTGCTLGTTEQTCGKTSCHNNTANTGGGTINITFSDINLKYTPGSTYDMTVSTDETGKVKFGFEITATDANGDSVGTFIIPVGVTNLSTPTSGAVNHRKYLGHKNASATKSWNFQWKAPAVNKGQLSFFASSNCANGNGNASGDHIYTTALSIFPDTANGIFAPQISSTSFSILNLANGQLSVQYLQVTSENVIIALYDLNGRLSQTFLNSTEEKGMQQHSFDLNHSLSSGIYLVRYSSGNTSAARKIFIQN